MQTAMNTPALKPWRIAALVLIVAVAMLFVHAIDLASGGISGQQAIAASTDH